MFLICTSWMAFISTLRPTRLAERGTINSKKRTYSINLLKKLNKIDPERTFYTMLVKRELRLYDKIKNSLRTHMYTQHYLKDVLFT